MIVLYYLGACALLGLSLMPAMHGVPQLLWSAAHFIGGVSLFLRALAQLRHDSRPSA